MIERVDDKTEIREERSPELKVVADAPAEGGQEQLQPEKSHDAAEIVSLSGSQPVSKDTIADPPQQKAGFQRVQRRQLAHFSCRMIDCLLVSIFGALLTSIAVWSLCSLLPSPAFGLEGILHTIYSVAAASFVIYLACCFGPIWFGLIMLGLQMLSGALVGTVSVQTICWLLRVDPSAIGWLAPFYSGLFTLLIGLLPPFALPLYRAVTESSPLRNTLAMAGLDEIVVDLRGRRLSFAHALKKAMLEPFSALLFLIDVVALKTRAVDRWSWVCQATGTMVIKKPEKLAEEISKARNCIRVRYRPFQEFEKLVSSAGNQNIPRVLVKEDLSFKRAKAVVHIMLLLVGAAAVVNVLRLPGDFMRHCFEHGVPMGDMPDYLSIAGAWILWLLQGSVGILFLYGVLSACKPSHIELTRKGLRFLSIGMPSFMQDPFTPWSQVRRLTVESTTGKTSVADRWLVFELDGGSKKRLRLGSVASVLGKEEILRAIERWSPHTPRDVEVIKALQPPLDYSYTELWLEALSAPPKRDKLKPLIEGAAVKENQYVVKSVLGSGGQGAAYLAQDCLENQVVVLKEFILPVYVDMAVRRKALETFQQEARLLKQLSNNRVVQLLDYFVEDHRAYLVLEHIDGDSLRAMVERDGPMPEARVRELALQMCEILVYLHGQAPPVVHRDFTPENLILRKDGTLKLIDFNVAQQSDTNTTGSVVGKPAYLPPEQFRGNPTRQSDLYALGACLHFLLTGEDPVPISASNPSEANPAVSFELSAVVQKATEPELEQRYASAYEVREALEGAGSG